MLEDPSSYWVYLRFKEESDVASQCVYALDIQEMRYLPLPNYPVDTYANTASSVLYNKLYVIANPVLGHGMIKFLKPSHAGRIWVRPFHNTCRSELSFNGTEEKFQSCRTVRTSSAREIYTCEDKILDLLKSPLPTNLTKLAEDLSVYRRAAVVAAVDGRVYMFGGYPVQDEEWGEVYDPSSNTWTPIPGCDTIRTNGMVYYSSGTCIWVSSELTQLRCWSTICNKRVDIFLALCLMEAANLFAEDGGCNC